MAPATPHGGMQGSDPMRGLTPSDWGYFTGMQSSAVNMPVSGSMS